MQTLLNPGEVLPFILRYSVWVCASVVWFKDSRVEAPHPTPPKNSLSAPSGFTDETYTPPAISHERLTITLPDDDGREVIGLTGNGNSRNVSV